MLVEVVKVRGRAELWDSACCGKGKNNDVKDKKKKLFNCGKLNKDKEKYLIEVN